VTDLRRLAMTSSAALPRSDELRQRLDAICAGQPFRTHWYLKDLISGQVEENLGRVVVPSASTRKISIMMAAFRAVHEGRMDLDAPITLDATMKEAVQGGTLRLMTPGLVIRLREAIIHMIITSDNVGTRIVTDRLDVAEINAYCRDIGLTGTIHNQGVPKPDIPYDHPVGDVTTTTAFDQGILLERILDGAQSPACAAELGCTTELCRYALEILSWQLYRERIAGLLPLDARVANKTGGGRRGQMDAGIVYRFGKPLFILTVYTDFVPPVMPDGLPGYCAADATIRLMARSCWDSIGDAVMAS
jgi:beta-lactamase class A